MADMRQRYAKTTRYLCVQELASEQSTRDGFVSDQKVIIEY